MVMNEDRMYNEIDKAMRLPVGSISELKSDEIDVRKENLRKIQQVVEQLSADIKYCDTKMQRMHDERNHLKESIAKLEHSMEKEEYVMQTLIATQDKIMAAAHTLDSPENAPEEDTGSDIKIDPHARRY